MKGTPLRRMNADSVTAWLAGAGRQPLLTPDEEVYLGQLVRAWQDHPAGPDGAPPAVRRRGKRARDRMVAGNLRLVAHVCGRLRASAPLADQLQAGAIGLMRAAEKFDPDRGYKFSTYAFMWIRQGVTINDAKCQTIRIPTNVYDAINNRRNGTVSAEQIEAARLAVFPRSLNQAVPGGDLETPLGDLLPDPATIESPVERQDHRQRYQAALQAMAAADPEALVLLELQHADGAGITQLADLEGATVHGIKNRLAAACEVMRSLPEVEQALSEVA